MNHRILLRTGGAMTGEGNGHQEVRLLEERTAVRQSSAFEELCRLAIPLLRGNQRLS